MTNKQAVEVSGEKPNNKLIHIDNTDKATRPAKDINNKINVLEDSLEALQSELEEVNKSVEEGLDQLGSSDLDITAKVSETYKRLGEIDNAYKSLSKISDDINSEVKKLNGDMKEVAKHSDEEFDRIETLSSAQVQTSKEQHENLVQRVDELISRSRKTNENLTVSIQKNTQALLAHEREVEEEIKTLADITQQRDDEIKSDVTKAKTNIEQNKAKIIQMQAVDEALAKRATAVEISAVELEEKSRQITSSVDLLDARTSDISGAVVRLKEKAEEQATLIYSIQGKAQDMAQSILALTSLERFHFRSITGVLLLMLLLLTSLFMYQQSINENVGVLRVEANEVVDQKVASLQQQNVQADAEISQINTRLVALNEELQSKLEVTNTKLQNLNDQAVSLDGRMNQTLPFSQFGKDNIIHGPQWLAKQPMNNMAIQLAVVDNAPALFEIAQRYGHSLNESMAYYSVITPKGEKFVLIHGSFTKPEEISAALYQLPRRINFQRPYVVSIADIQKVISG